MTVTYFLKSAPPSVNESRIPVIRKGRPQIITSPVYRAWIEQAGWELKAQKKPISYFSKRDYWRSDILIPRSLSNCDVDNHIKAIHDAIGKAGLTPDDRYLVDTRCRFSLGDRITIALKKESTDSWTIIMKPSKWLTSQRAKSSRLKPRTN